MGRLWSTLLAKLYGDGVYFDLFHLQVANKMSPIFKDIIRLKNWPDLSSVISPNNFVWSLRNGSSSLFWHDNWQFNSPLKYFFFGFFYTIKLSK